MNSIEASKAAAPSAAAAKAAQKAREAAQKASAKSGSGGRAFSRQPRNSKFPLKELIKFCRGMASMLKAQINTSDALKYYAQGHPNAEVRKTLAQIRAMIDAGAPAYIAFEKTKKFDDKFISLVRAGTDSGQIHRAFESIAHRLKKEAEFKSKVRKATLLPSIIICVLIGLFIIAQCKIVPTVEGLLADVRQEPDPMSKVLFKVSHVVQNVWPFVVIGLGSFVTALFLAEKFRNTVLYLAMSKWRLLRQLVMGMRQILFLGTLNMLHGNGVTLAKSISIAATALKGTPMFNELNEAGKRYQLSGLPFSEALKKYTSCDAQVAHMVSIGERSSSLDAQLELLTGMYEEELEQVVGDFTAAVNIIALITACILISAVFIGAFLPIFLMGPKMMNSAM